MLHKKKKKGVGRGVNIGTVGKSCLLKFIMTPELPPAQAKTTALAQRYLSRTCDTCTMPPFIVYVTTN
jgi:hypothetical protein